MPIKIPDHLPARQTLQTEGVAVMSETDAIRQDIRPLRIGLLNLMPNKISTETQLARLLGATPLQIELTLVRMTDHVARNASPDHMSAFYRPWSEVSHEKFDGFIITGAPVERMPFEDVTLLGGDAAHLRLDADARAFDVQYLLGGAGGGLSLPWRAQA